MIQIGVMGSFRDNLDPKAYEMAKEVGKHIAKKGAVLFTGGSLGVMEYSMKGCIESGGYAIGVLPAESREQYKHCLSKYITLTINTGMGEAGRIPVLINTCDGIIAIGGGIGTMAEICMAYHQGKPVVILDGTGGTCERIKSILDEEGYMDHNRIVKVQFATCAQEAVDKLIHELKNGEKADLLKYDPKDHTRRA